MKKYIIEFLDNDSVSVGVQSFVDFDGESQPVGKLMRRAYANSDADRKNITQDLPEQYYTMIITFWGPTATVVPTPEHTVPYGESNG